MSPETKATAAFAVLLWAVAIVTITAWVYGDPTAANGTIGCGVPAVFFTVFAWWMARQDRR